MAPSTKLRLIDDRASRAHLEQLTLEIFRLIDRRTQDYVAIAEKVQALHAMLTREDWRTWLARMDWSEAITARQFFPRYRPRA